ncbi:MAG: 23S rRNA (guanosine(2251)-2'-O)-methyltransferase RlmB [Candidatus Omnitrophica bacterium]|nr:23S rRNA (guanosine(2251)-2'-O)-methyltransferase RlmB [Candidatus Omnitrophota bacterium]
MIRLYGKNQVVERLKTRPKTIQKIIFKKSTDNGFIEKLAVENNIPHVLLSDKEFISISNNINNQGVIAQIQDFQYTDLEDILQLPNEKKLTLIALSNITDPQNLGSILRTTACFGRFALIIPKHRSASITESVLKVACGGENYIPVIQETNLIPVIKQTKDAGYWVAGTVVEDGVDLTGFNFQFPLCLVIGSEDKGIRSGLMSHLDFKVTLPMPGAGLSLNAAVATAIFCYEVIRQKR